jgi:hypothetical protein
MTTDLKVNQLNAHRGLLGKRVAARLSESAEALPHDVLERLKAGRMHALQLRKVATAKTAASVTGFGHGSSLQLGMQRGDGWGPFASLIPLLALVVGLLTISVLQDEYRAQELADVDAELLTDDLPPSAYTDPGFAQFLHPHQGD